MGSLAGLSPRPAVTSAFKHSIFTIDIQQDTREDFNETTRKFFRVFVQNANATAFGQRVDWKLSDDSYVSVNIRCTQPLHAREVVVAKTGFASNRKKTKDSESSTASGPTGNTSRLARKPVALISSFHSALPGLNVEQWAVWSNRSLARRDLSLVTVVETVSSLASPTDGSESDNHSDRSCGSCTTPPERVSTLGEVRLGFTHVRLDVKQLDRHRGRHHRLAV